MVKKVFPFIGWFKGYGFADLRADCISGLTVALVLIPQSMAYAQLAGLPAYYGLYASFVPPMMASLFGSSRQLATGPVAIVSLMTSASLEPLATAGSPGFIAYAILLALMVGVFQLSLGILRLGLVVNFLSHPVVNGFTNAAAIIIASSQLSKLFGVYVDGAEHHYITIARVVGAAFHYTHWPSLCMGVLSFGIMYTLKRISPRIPNVLVAVVITTLLSWAMGFENNNHAGIQDIQDEETIGIIQQFNRDLEEVSNLANGRTDIYNVLGAAKAHHDILRVLDARHDAEVISFKIFQLKDKIHESRKQLREKLFEKSVDQKGGTVFYLKGQMPDHLEKASGIWRIKVGNNPLDEKDLLMTGGGAVVGKIPQGLPKFSLPNLDMKVMVHLFPYAAIISLLGFMEAISIAKAMAGKTGQRLDPNQELIGQGVANILGCLSKSYPTSGSFSRSAVNLQAGAVSGLSSVFTSFTVVIVLIFFTPLLFHLPQAVLASVIMMAVIGLVNVSGFIHAWEAQWYDGVISVISFVATLVFAPELERGIMIGVVLSLGVFLYKNMRPKMASLARHTDEALRCSETFGLQECRYISMVRFDGPLFSPTPATWKTGSWSS